MRGSEKGFSLLEAIVALAVLSATLVPLFLLISGATRSAVRLDQSNRTAEIELNALNVMSAVNPMDQSSGSVDLGPYAIRWNAHPIADPVLGSDYPAGNGRYLIGLYDSQVEAVDRGNQVLLRFPLRLIGFKRSEPASPAARPIP